MKLAIMTDRPTADRQNHKGREVSLPIEDSERIQIKKELFPLAARTAFTGLRKII